MDDFEKNLHKLMNGPEPEDSEFMEIFSIKSSQT